MMYVSHTFSSLLTLHDHDGHPISSFTPFSSTQHTRHAAAPLLCEMIFTSTISTQAQEDELENLRHGLSVFPPISIMCILTIDYS